MPSARCGVLGAVVAAALCAPGIAAPAHADDAVLSLTSGAGTVALPGVPLDLTAALTGGGEGSVVVRDGDRLVGQPVSVSRSRPAARWSVSGLGPGLHHLVAEFTPLDSAQPHALGALDQLIADSSLLLPTSGSFSAPLSVTRAESCPSPDDIVTVSVDGRGALQAAAGTTNVWRTAATLADLGLGVGRHDVTVACAPPGSGSVTASSSPLWVTWDDPTYGTWESTDASPVATAVSLMAVPSGSGRQRTVVVTASVSGSAPGAMTVFDGTRPLRGTRAASLRWASPALARGEHHLTATFVPDARAHVLASRSATVDLGVAGRVALPPSQRLGNALPLPSFSTCPALRTTVSSSVAHWSAVPVRPGQSLVDVAQGIGTPVVPGRYDLTVRCGGSRVLKGTLWVTDPDPVAGWWETVNPLPDLSSTSVEVVDASTLVVRVTPAVRGTLVLRAGSSVVQRRALSAADARTPLSLHVDRTGTPVTVSWHPGDVIAHQASSAPAVVLAGTPAVSPRGARLPAEPSGTLVPDGAVAPSSAAPVPQEGGGGLSISTPYSPDRPLSLGDLVLNTRGDAYVGTAVFGGIQVNDARPAGGQWTMTMSTTDLVGTAEDVIPANRVSFDDVTVLGACLPGCYARPLPQGAGIDVRGTGDGVLGGTMQVTAPTSTSVGTYTGTFTITIS